MKKFLKNLEEFGLLLIGIKVLDLKIWFLY